MVTTLHSRQDSKVARERPSLAGEGDYWSQMRSNPPRMGNLSISSREMAVRTALNYSVIKSQTDFTEPTWQQREVIATERSLKSLWMRSIGTRSSSFARLPLQRPTSFTLFCMKGEVSGNGRKEGEGRGKFQRITNRDYIWQMNATDAWLCVERVERIANVVLIYWVDTGTKKWKWANNYFKICRFTEPECDKWRCHHTMYTSSGEVSSRKQLASSDDTVLQSTRWLHKSYLPMEGKTPSLADSSFDEKWGREGGHFSESPIGIISSRWMQQTLGCVLREWKGVEKVCWYIEWIQGQRHGSERTDISRCSD